jgi:hypothetical protein
VPFLCTLAQLRPLVRSQAGVQRIRFIDDADLNGWIIAAWVRLYHDYCNWGQPYFETTASPTASSEVITVPAELYRLRRVDYMVDGKPEPLDDLDVHEVALVQGATAPAGRAVGYRLRASEIQLPGAADGQTYRITYAPRPTEPANDTDTMDTVDVVGREWVVLQAAIRAVQKQREDASQLELAARDVHTQLQRSARRTTTRLGRVQDTSSWQYEDPYLSGGLGGRRRWP